MMKMVLGEENPEAEEGSKKWSFLVSYTAKKNVSNVLSLGKGVVLMNPSS